MNSKNAILVLLLLSYSTAGFSCGFYPFGEDLRFCFLDPKSFQYGSYSEFYYTSNSFDSDTSQKKAITPNEQLWMEYCGQKVSLEATRAALTFMPADAIRPNSPNAMVAFLYAKKDLEAVNYLRFAKECETINAGVSDVWERGEAVSAKAARKAIGQALRCARTTQNPQLSRRYAFQAVRLAFYSGESESIRNIFEEFFSKGDNDILKYWSLYFNCFGQENTALADFWAAQVFANAPDKRFAVYNQLYDKSSLESAVQYAASNEEKANVYVLEAVGKHFPALVDLERIYALDPDSEGLDFLLLREMNKIEDWIFTPYYSLFNPSVNSAKLQYDDDANSEAILRRVESDRLYAQKVLAFVSSANLSKVHDPMLWQSAKAELLFATMRYDEAVSTVSAIEERAVKDATLYNQLQIVKALAMTARQKPGFAVIVPEVRRILLANSTNRKFIFAVGRELENKGNTTDAALLYAALRPEYNWEEDSRSMVFWRQKNSKSQNYYTDYYSDYFSYLNHVYTPEQVALLIADVERNKRAQAQDDFKSWLYEIANREYFALLDLLGTKYIRRDDLASAEKTFKKIPNVLGAQLYSLGAQRE